MKSSKPQVQCVYVTVQLLEITKYDIYESHTHLGVEVTRMVPPRVAPSLTRHTEMCKVEVRNTDAALMQGNKTYQKPSQMSVCLVALTTCAY